MVPGSGVRWSAAAPAAPAALRESVADASGRADTVRIRAGLHPQCSHDDVDNVAGTVVVITPNLGEKLLSCDNAPATSRKQ